MSGGVKMHERVMIVQKAHNKLASALIEIGQEFGLTPSEEASILHQCMGQSLKYVIRYERHGNYDKRGGEAD